MNGRDYLMKTYSVLVADDDPQIRAIVSRVCDELGWRAHEARDGLEALNLLENQSPQIFVIDVRMPGPSGIDLAQKILLKVPAAAILILTGYTEIEQAVQAIRSGIYDYVQKDRVDLDGLKSLLVKAAKYHESRMQFIQAMKDREAAIEDIQQANFEFQTILEFSSALIVIFNARTGQMKDCNSAALAELRYDRKEWKNLHYYEIDAALEKAHWEEWLETIKEGKAAHIERTFRPRQGVEFPVEITLTYVCSNTGEWIVGIAQDIRERKALQERLRYERYLLDVLMNTLPDNIYFKDLESRYLLANQAFATRMNCESAIELLGRKDTDFFPTEFAEQLRAEEIPLLEMGIPVVDRQRRTTFPNGDVDWLLVSKYPIRDSQGKITGLVGISRNVNEVKRTQELLEEKTTVLEQITASAQDAIIKIDEKGLITFWNPAAQRIFGYFEEEAIGKDLHELLAPPKYRASHRERFKEFIKSGKGNAVGKNLELEAIRKDGMIFPIELSLSSVLIKGKWNAIGIIRDISERKQAEFEIQQARKITEIQITMLSTIINFMEEGIVMADNENRITEANEWFIRLAQTPKEFICGQQIDKIIHLISGVDIKPSLEKYQQGVEFNQESFRGELSGMKVQYVLQPLFQDDLYEGLILNIRDLTSILSGHDKMTEDALQIKNRLADMKMNMMLPLQCLQDMSEQLSKTDVSDEQRLLIDMIRESGDTLKAIVDTANTDDQEKVV